MYHFVDLTEEQRHERRELLDRYALLAQVSAVAPLVAIQIFIVVRWLSRKLSKATVLGSRISPPSSPYVKHEDAAAATGPTTLKALASFWDRAAWWFGEDIPTLESTRGEVLFSAIWSAWLLGLCFVQTGDDYLHFTKRLGLIPASQLPIHYLLSLKTPYSPISLLTRSSHESLISVHQHLGRIITLFFAGHVALYTNFFVLSNLLAAKLTQAYIICGYLAFIAFAVIGTTALTWVRQRNYRLFYTAHVVLSLLVLPALWIHVHHIRVFLYQTLAVYALNLVLRAFATQTHIAKLSLVPNTQNLVQITFPGLQSSSSSNSPTFEAVAPDKVARLQKGWHAGHHAYISVASPKRMLPRPWSRGNPFTAATIPASTSHSSRTAANKSTDLTFVARILKGSTARLLAQEGQAERLLSIEGPYGLTVHSDRLLQYDRVLFVAGGVGGTFCAPLYKQLLEDLSPSKGSYRRGKVSFLWLVKNVADMMWALPDEKSDREGFVERLRVCVTGMSGSSHSAGAGKFMATGNADGKNDAEDDEEGIEMEERKNLLGAAAVLDEADASLLKDTGLVVHSGRPDLAQAVGQAFAPSRSERVAIVVCGPKSLTQQLRREVGRYVHRGRKLFFWEERFAL